MRKAVCYTNKTGIVLIVSDLGEEGEVEEVEEMRWNRYRKVGIAG